VLLYASENTMLVGHQAGAAVTRDALPASAGHSFA